MHLLNTTWYLSSNTNQSQILVSSCHQMNNALPSLSDLLILNSYQSFWLRLHSSAFNNQRESSEALWQQKDFMWKAWHFYFQMMRRAGIRTSRPWWYKNGYWWNPSSLFSKFQVVLFWFCYDFPDYFYSTVWTIWQSISQRVLNGYSQKSISVTQAANTSSISERLLAWEKQKNGWLSMTLPPPHKRNNGNS